MMSGLNQDGQYVAKTTKLFIKGEFPRTESGRSYPVMVYESDRVFAHLCQSSRKDLRNAVVAAASALSGWSERTAYNRGQILFRMAEMLEGKRVEFVAALEQVMGLSLDESMKQVSEAVDALVYYAGFTDKFSQVMSSVNPVSGPFHNFTQPEPVGVVGVLCDDEFSLPKFFSQLAAVICSGNTCVVVFDKPGAALLSEMAEVFKTSDLPAGVINLLSGQVEELQTIMGQHMEIHSLLYTGQNKERLSTLKEMAIENMKRVVSWEFKDKDLAPITAFVENKTIWHPVGL